MMIGQMEISKSNTNSNTRNDKNVNSTMNNSANTSNALTVRAVISGAFVGIIIASMNVSFGLKTGWSQAGSVLAAVVAIGLFTFMKPLKPFTQEEANVAQTVASAAGSMTMSAGLIGPMPALALLGYEFTYVGLSAWSIAVAYLGVFLAVPMREKMLDLKFPSGTATACTIRAAFSGTNTITNTNNYSIMMDNVVASGDSSSKNNNNNNNNSIGGKGGGEEGKGGEDRAGKQFKSLLVAAFVSFVTAIVAWMYPPFLRPPVVVYIFLIGPELAKRGFGLRLDFALVGGGMLMGEKVGSSILIGAVLAWGVIAPIAENHNWCPSKDPMDMKLGARGLLLWPGVTFMAIDSFSQLFKAMIVAKFAAQNESNQIIIIHETERDEDAILSATPFTDSENVPRSWWVYGLTFAIISSMISQRILFGIHWSTAIMSIPVGLGLTYVAVRCAGETDINPIGPMGKIIQLIFAFLAPGELFSNLVTAAIACGGAGQAGDLMHDFKCGSILRLAPRTQLIAQMLGVPFGVLGAVPSFLLFLRTYELGGEEYPAPSAFAWKAVAEVLTGTTKEGNKGVAIHAVYMSLIAALFAVFVRMVEFKMQYRSTQRMKQLAERIIPSPMALGIAFIIPPEFSVMVFIGACIVSGGWRRRNKESFESLSQLVAAGFLAGSGVGGVLSALVTIVKGQ